MENKKKEVTKRNLISNVVLENHIFGVRQKDFVKYVLPTAIIMILANLISIVGYYHYSLLLICGAILSIGGTLLAFYEVEYCYRACDILKEYVDYYKKGDRLYEKFKKE